jgi:RND family efflux transporter MFP subunit
MTDPTSVNPPAEPNMRAPVAPNVPQPTLGADGQPAAASRHPIQRSGEGHWRTFVLVGAVAVAAFSFGNFWTREIAAPIGVSGGAPSDSKVSHAAMSTENGSAMSAPRPEPKLGKPLWTCAMHPQVIQDHPGLCPICHMELTPIRARATGDMTVSIDPVIVQNMGVRTAVVRKGALVQSIRAVGYLNEPEPLHHDINLRVNGWIEKLYANVDGMTVEKDQPLFDLYSPELTVAADEMISARRQLDAAPTDATSKLLFDTAKRKLRQLGVGEQQVAEIAKLDAAPRTVAFLSPFTGHVTAKRVFEGDAVKAGDLVMRIASRHEMWIEAQVYEQQLGLVSEGQPVRATIVSQPGRVFTGKVIFIHPHLDPQTRTALVRIAISNSDHSLRENMYATVEILADNYREELVVPREAVIDSGRRQVAFVALGGGRFEPRLLQLGASGQDDTVQVLAGLKAGETVVTSGQFLIDSESRLKESLAKYMSAGAAGTATPDARTGDHVGMPKGQPSTVAAARPIPHIDEVARAYLAVSKALGERQLDANAIDVEPFTRATRLAADNAEGDGKLLAAALADRVDLMSGKPIDQQREIFVKVGSATKAVFKFTKPSLAVAPHLYVFECPMAFGSGGATWIQDSDSAANPFYAVEMKKCGSVIERIDPDK